jgi:hypothetical protein
MIKRFTLRNGFLKAGSAMQFFSRNMRLMYFLFGLGMVYITMALMVEKRIRNIEYLKKDIKEIRWEYMSVKSDLMYHSTYTQVSNSASATFGKQSDTAPKRILVGYRP